MLIKKKNIIISILVFMWIVAFSFTCNAVSNQNDFPERPITLLIPYSPGGGSDVGARLLQPYVEEELGVPIVIENRPGAGGAVGFTEIANSNADGYKIGYFNQPSGVGALLMRPEETEYDLESFEYLPLIYATPRMYAVSKDSPFDTLTDLVEYALENPGKLSAGTTGFGGFADLTVIGLQVETGIDIKRIPLGGGANTIAQAMAGEIDLAPIAFAEGVAPIDAGELKPLCVLTEERHEAYPDTPTALEEGYNIVFSGSQGLIAPLGTPPEKLKVIEEAWLRAMQNPDFQREVKELGHFLWDGNRTGESHREFVYEMHDLIKNLLEVASEE
ncbi:MAG: tripartite tricarboxylate transporter substrate binding protein [Eubacteriales bacterium]